MAQINYEDVNAANEGSFDVGFFSLKSDGAEAVVRILCDQVSDLDILTVHPVTVGQSAFPNRNVNCLRTPRDPMDMCPFCAAGEKVRQRVFIKMIQYDPQTRKPQAVVWDRPAGVFVPMLKSYIDNYGPLSQIVCKIIRHGSGLDTKYDIIPNLNPQIFTLEAYPLDTSDFEDFKVLGRMVLDKTAEEMIAYKQTGSFPEKPKSNTYVVSAPDNPQPIPGGYNAQPTQAPVSQTPQGIPNGYQQPYQQPIAQSFNELPPQQIPSTDPWGNPIEHTGGPAPMDQGSLGRPQRYY